MFVSLLYFLFVSAPKCSASVPFPPYSPRSCLGSPFGRCFLWLYRSVLPNLWEPISRGVCSFPCVCSRLSVSAAFFSPLFLSRRFNFLTALLGITVYPSVRSYQEEWLMWHGFVWLLLFKYQTREKARPKTPGSVCARNWHPPRQRFTGNYCRCDLYVLCV